MTVQNGLGAEEIVRRHGDWPLISAVTFMSGRATTTPTSSTSSTRQTWLGPYAGTDPYERVEEVRDAARRSGSRREAFADLLPAQWSKLIFNATSTPSPR